MTPDLKQLAEKPRDAVILDENGKPVLGGDHEKRFFEASWMFKRGDGGTPPSSAKASDTSSGPTTGPISDPAD